MTTKSDDLARAIGTFEAIAEQVEGRGFSAPTVIDAMLAIAIGLALALFEPAVVVQRLRDVADRVERGERDAAKLTRH